ICIQYFSHAFLSFYVLNYEQVYRHGDRSPTETFPTDPHKEDTWPQGFGQLTTIGMQQHYEFGQFLRERYADFLNSTYNQQEVYIRSTDFDRTLMSAQVNLAGLYPPRGQQVWNSNVLWQPIPIHTVSKLKEKLLDFPIPDCPRFNQLQSETSMSPEFQEKFQPYKDFSQRVASYAGYSPEEMDLQKLATVYDSLLCEEIHNYSLPSWATPETRSKLLELTELAELASFGIYRREEKARLSGGVLVKTILENITKVANNPQQLKLIMYSAHDTTIIALQMALNVWSGRLPPYCACHIFELYQESNGQFTIGMYYQNDSHSDLYEVVLPGCTSPCPLQNFVELTSGIIPKDLEEECMTD
uniref:acid phosphatase n=1 Tax=Latimeria chalumnae TaxID=7897 RepID=H3AQL7_LATCH